MNKLLMIIVFCIGSVAMADDNCPDINGKFKCGAWIYEIETTVNKDTVANHYDIKVSNNSLLNFKGLSDGIAQKDGDVKGINQYARPYCAFNSLLIEYAYLANGQGHYINTTSFTLGDDSKLHLDNTTYEQQGSAGANLNTRKNRPCQTL